MSGNEKEASDNWLGTNSGRRIVLASPQPHSIHIEDIADGLSKVCRFNGQIKQWYSVAEHSYNVMQLCGKPFGLLALLHDATEAYLCDVPTPLKAELGEAYKAIERRLALCIGMAFGLEDNALVDLPEQVRMADTMMAVTERDHLQKSPQVWPEKYEKSLRFPNFKVRWDTPDKARAGWLKAMADLGITSTIDTQPRFRRWDTVLSTGTDGYGLVAEPETTMWHNLTTASDTSPDF